MLQLFLILVGDVLQSPVSVLYALELFVESLPVAGYLAQIPLDSDELFTGTGLSIFYYSLRQPHLACKLKCERVARQSHFKFEHRSDILHIEHHGPVCDSGVSRSIQFQVCIVGRDDSIYASLVELSEYRFRNRSSRSRLSTRTELVNQDKCP